MASKEANKPEVKAYVNRLKEKIEDRFAIEQTKDEAFVRALIWRRLDYCEAHNDDSSIKAYADIINKMNGTYINITKDITERDTTLKDLSVDQLKQLLAAPLEKQTQPVN